MGHVNAPMMLGALGVIEMGLIALEIPHGSGGAQKAIEYLGNNVQPWLVDFNLYACDPLATIGDEKYMLRWNVRPR